MYRHIVYRMIFNSVINCLVQKLMLQHLHISEIKMFCTLTFVYIRVAPRKNKHKSQYQKSLTIYTN